MSGDIFEYTQYLNTDCTVIINNNIYYSFGDLQLFSGIREYYNIM